ncbi:TPA: hypothetical protein PWV15_002171 [Mannheimia haemolytica]|nr:hypothetical protein [Mannheimia haemolytica]
MYQVFIAEPKDPNLEKGLLKHFIKSYLTQEELDFLHKILTNLPNIRPFWGDTSYKYIVIDNVYFLYEVSESEKKVILLGTKFNNKRKTFNFANTKTQKKSMKKWINDLAIYKPHKINQSQ